jgi:SAM-dependent methyltransferase
MGNIISENSLKSLPKSQKSKLNIGNKKRIKRRSSISTAMTSTTTHSSESTYRYVDGRRFNGNTKYSLPNDDAEVDRLQLQHYLQRYIWQGNFCAPVHRSLKKPGARVLDVGCGPGTWILEMAFDYPDAHFTGIDISPMYPKEIKPSNVNFEEADLTEGLPFADDTFDFVVMRNMLNALSVDDWVYCLKELERVCKPGGFVECLEFQIPAIHLGKISKRVVEACKYYIQNNFFFIYIFIKTNF